ncbi:MAG: hypothetical protein ABSE62_12575 [Chthoniobacteraceae bacterium]
MRRPERRLLDRADGILRDLDRSLDGLIDGALGDRFFESGRLAGPVDLLERAQLSQPEKEHLPPGALIIAEAGAENEKTGEAIGRRLGVDGVIRAGENGGGEELGRGDGGGRFGGDLLGEDGNGSEQ